MSANLPHAGAPPKDLAARDAGARALDELRRRGGLGITVQDRGHAAQLLTAWEQIPTDGSDYEWSTILHDCASYLLAREVPSDG